MSFATVINCMDGRVQKPVTEYLLKKFDVKYIDVITEPGPNLILAEQKNKDLLNSIANRLEISIKKHHSNNIAIVGHHDCAGNPTSKENQLIHLSESIKKLKSAYPNVNVIGLWVNDAWGVEEIL